MDESGNGDLSAKQLWYMVRVYRFCCNPRFKGGFRSANALARSFENSLNPSVFVKDLIRRMVELRLLRVDVVGGVERIVLDRDAFEVWFEGTGFGRDLIGYVDDISEVRF